MRRPQRISSTANGAKSGLLLSKPIRLLQLFLLLQLSSSASGASADRKSQADVGRRLPRLSMQSSSCDTLLSARENLAAYCQCTAAAGSSEAPTLIQTLDLREQTKSPPETATTIHQLDCTPQSLALIIEDLRELTGSGSDPAEGAQRARLKLRVNFLNINTNLSEPSRAKRKWSAERSSINHNNNSQGSLPAAILEVDHMSLQLDSVGRLGEEKFVSPWRRLLQEQMINLAALLDRTHLQFLSISLNNNNSEEGFQDSPEVGGQEVEFFELLNRFTGLQRFEMSLDAGQQASAGNSILLWPQSGHQSTKLNQLKWLNLASNKKLAFGQTNRLDNKSQGGSLGFASLSPFYYISSLEHLSLEACNLSSFPLASLFASNGSSIEGDHSAGVSFAMANLASLNLAANNLDSLEEDLFVGLELFEWAEVGPSSEGGGHWKTSGKQAKQKKYCNRDSHNNANLPLLPSLTMLDLSYNQIEEIPAKVGQFFLCSMPQLNQIYLQHNRIKHLNLNSLLQMPAFPLAQAFNAGDKISLSKLEYLDLSHNQLARLTAVAGGFLPEPSAGWPKENNSARLKYVNLAFNHLPKALNLIERNLFDRVIFADSISGDLNHLEVSFEVHANSSGISICDFLWPSQQNPPVGSSPDASQELLLNDNQIESITREFSSQKCKLVNILSLRNNRISSLSFEAFSMMSNLDRLDLSGNSLGQLLDVRLFANNQQLKYLDLSKNKLKQVDRNIFIHLSKLEELLLNDNELFALPSELTFAHNPSLTAIDFSRNRLTSLAGGLFASLANLQSLLVSGNKLSQFHGSLWEVREGTRPEFRREEYPNVGRPASEHGASQRRLNERKGSSQVPAGNKGLGGQQKSQDKKRSHSRREAPAGAEREPATNSLLLDQNSLESLKLESSNGSCNLFLLKIEHLSLSSNRLRELSNSSFKCTPFVQRLILRDNSLVLIGSETFRKLEQLSHLDLSQNKLSQMVGLPEVSQLQLELSQNQLVSFKWSEMVAKRPGESKLQLDLLDLSYNPRLRLNASELREVISSQQPRRLNLAGVESIKVVSGWQSELQVEPGAVKLSISLLDLSALAEPIDEAFLEFLETAILSIERLELNFVEAQPGSAANKLDSLLVHCLQNGLQELSFTGNLYNLNQFTRVFAEVESEFLELNRLNLSSNRLDVLPLTNSTQLKLAGLREFDLSQNKLKYFIGRDQVEFQFKELELLNLSSNSLVGVAELSNWNSQSKSLANFAPKLRKLDLSHNRLTWLPGQLFQHSSSIVWLSLTHNHFETLPANLLDSLLLSLGPNMLLDLSHNRRLQSTGSQQSRPSSKFRSSLIEPNESLVLFMSESSSPSCSSIDYFINWRRSMNGSQQGEQASSGENEDDLENRLAGEQCRRLLDSIDLLRLDSSLLKSDSISLQPSGRLFHLSLRGNSLYVLNPFDKKLADSLISLDLSDNKLQELADSSLAWLSSLRSLNLARNQIRQLPASLIDTKVGFLSLESNKISSLRNLRSSKGESWLLALILRDNYLTELRQEDLGRLRRLRYLDLRANPILALNQQLRLSTSVYVEADFRPAEQQPKFKLRGDEQSLYIERMAGSKVGGFSLTIDGSSSEAASSSYVLKYCALRTRTKHEICLRSEEVACFRLARPNGASCLTSLEEPAGNQSVGQSVAMQKGAPADSPERSASNRTEESADLVLKAIELAKVYWLRLKRVEPAQVSQAIGDFLWRAEGTSQFSPNAILLLRATLLLGSSTVIVLLVAMFVLLTGEKASSRRTRKSDLQEDSSESRSQSELTETITETNELTGSSSLKNSSASSQSKLSSELEQSCSRDQETVLERRLAGKSLALEQLEASRQLQMLLQQANQQQQLLQCSTPSSSLAPSSVETAETLQAVDSIQSGSNISGQYQHYAGQQQLPAQVATVMRMVKSNSASFGRQPAASYADHNSACRYGTINNSNYSQLRSKIRFMNQQQGVQVYPAPELATGYQPDPFYQLVEGVAATPTGFDPAGEAACADPTTVSLLSLNSALSSGIYQAANQESGQQLYYQQPVTIVCQGLAEAPDQQQQVPAGGLILEQEEEEESFPLPPASRAIEVLQNPMRFLHSDLPFYSHNNTHATNPHHRKP